jgi:hypothetical protein
MGGKPHKPKKDTRSPSKKKTAVKKDTRSPSKKKTAVKKDTRSPSKGYPKLTAAQERQIRSETAFVAKSASTTAKKKAKPKAKPKKKAYKPY